MLSILFNEPARRVDPFARRAAPRDQPAPRPVPPARGRLRFAVAVTLAMPLITARAQSAAASDSVDLGALVAQALAVNPGLRAARQQAEAMRARVLPAGLRADPTLMLGLVNQPLGATPNMLSVNGVPVNSSGPVPMTMYMVGVGQSLPFPGKLPLRRRVAEREADVADRTADVVSRQVVRDVKDAWFELAFVDRALTIVERNRDVLSGIIRISDARYSVGSAGQEDVLKARIEATRLAELAVGLSEQRRTTLARVNAMLDRPSATPIANPVVPARLARAAVGQSPDAIRFTSAALGARAAESPLPPLAELQALALRGSAELREHEAMITTQAARFDLARKEFQPDFDVSVQFGYRSGGLPAMLSAYISVPVPVQKRSRQDQLVAGSGATLASLHAEHDAKVNQIRADVARLASEIERARGQLALYVTAILPQGRASQAQTTASYQVGRVDLLTLLDTQATLFRYETEYYRALTDFAKSMSELERVVGREILP